MKMLRKRELLKVFKKMLNDYCVANKDGRTHKFDVIIRQFVSDNKTSIDFQKDHEGLSTKEEMEIIFYYMFHFSFRDERWFDQDPTNVGAHMRLNLNPSWINLNDFKTNYLEKKGGRLARKVGELMYKLYWGLETVTTGERFWLDEKIKERIGFKESSY